VLDYKIKELKKQIDPREQEIQDMKDQVSRNPVFFRSKRVVIRRKPFVSWLKTIATQP
jgi:hypothetical protein